MHSKLLKSVLGANSGFFQANPTGRLLNRFSRDMNNVDANLPNQFDQVWLICIWFELIFRKSN